VLGLSAERLLATAVSAAEEAGDVIRNAFGDPQLASWSKTDREIVTHIDIESEQIIRERFAAATPGVDIVGEELGGELGATCWVIDPLDGTANFARAYPSVAVSIAFLSDGLPLVGVVHAPLWGKTYTAIRGQGARMNAARIAVSRRPATQALCATGIPCRDTTLLDAYLSVLELTVREVHDIRRVGPASLDLALVACGQFDGFFELGLAPWDVGAGGLLVEEAGGVVTDWTGDLVAWSVSGNIIAASPDLHKRLLEHALTAATR
jgi:myo-inositol-1(or 4)-monophosphatase